MSHTAQPFLRAIDLSKRYGAVEALLHVDLDIYPGDVIGVVGDTNSGKTTLLRLIAGGMSPDSGTFVVNGQRTRLAPSHRAGRLGIKAVYQDINAAEHMNALGYIFAGQAPPGRTLLRWIGWWHPRQLRALARVQFERLGFHPPALDCPLHDLTSAQRKMVALVQATIVPPRLLLLDEPMDALEAYRAQIVALIESSRERGTAVLLVTQNLEDVFNVADRIVVLNAGHKIAERSTHDTTEEEIVSLILGSVENRLTPAVWALSNYFEVRRQADELDQLYKALERRAAQLQAHAEVARSATSILDRDKLLTQIVAIIQQRFGYYYTGIFLVDAAGDSVVLRSNACRSGQQLGEVRLRISEVDSMVGWCAATGRSRLANTVAEDPLYKQESTLPDTRSELVLPLHIGERVLGVLDLQSDRPNTFDAEDMRTMQALADQLAIAIRNADLFEAAQIARRQADDANRYKSVFLSNMSHELRTPLSVIIGHTQAMLSTTSDFYSTPLPDDYLRDLETIRKSGAHLLALINDILDLSKIEAGKMRVRPAVIALADILDDMLRSAEGMIQGRAITVRAEYPDDLPPAWGDSVRTRQILLNLVTNALKFTEQGSVTLRATVQPEMLTVSVADTGIGIPAHQLDNIFERFRQGDAVRSRRYGGAGLGLSITRQLVEMQGGRIWVQSAVGVGTTVFFTVPRATAEQIATQASDAGADAEDALFDAQRMVIFQPQAQDIPAQQRLILLAQDETADSDALRQALENAGYVVEHTLVDESLLEMAEIMLPDMVILDATGPAGSALHARLQQAAFMANVPALVFTGDSETRSGPVRSHVYTMSRDSATPQAVVRTVNACFTDGARAPR